MRKWVMGDGSWGVRSGARRPSSGKCAPDAALGRPACCTTNVSARHRFQPEELSVALVSNRCNAIRGSPAVRPSSRCAPTGGLRRFGSASITFCFVCLFAANLNATNAPTVGLEGHAVVELPRREYQVKPVDDRSELILRIENVAPAGTNFAYDFHYIGLESHTYDLADYLLRADGEPAKELSNIVIRVGSILPKDHDGKLVESVRGPFPWLGGYRAALIAAAAAWFAGLVWFAVALRRKVVPPAPPPPAPPTLAERLRPLVEAAAGGKLSAEGQAQLERLLLGYWREKLNLAADLPMAVALARLKSHTEAGAIVRALEAWLHSPRGATDTEVSELLKPYAKP